MGLAFLESPRFNTEIRYGTVGGAEFNTDVMTVNSGSEFRNANWLDSRGAWQVGDGVFNRAEIDWLIAFFRDRMGRAGGFRFKDWADWQCVARATYREGVVSAIAGSGAMQMMKRYVVDAPGAASTLRKITKPVSGTITLYNGAGVAQTSGFTIDYTTGRVTGAASDWTWTGEFDVPARFDADKFSATFEGYRPGPDGESLFTVQGLTIVELRE